MVLTAAQITSFFQTATQMAIPNETRTQLSVEGIKTVDDLLDFDKDSLDQVANNLRRPGGGASPFVFGAKSHKRLLVATKLVKFYHTVGRTLSSDNMQWTHVMRNFEEQWKALEDRKSEDAPDTPLISKDLPVIKWVEAFRDHLHRCIGSRCVPLAYVIRDVTDVPEVVPTLATDQPYSTEHGSIEFELIARADHEHGLFRDDNAQVYYKLEEATRGTQYAATIKPFQRKRSGREAFESIQNQYAGVDKWEIELKKQDAILHTRKWRGQGNYTLEKFCQHHRNAFVTMQQCSQYVAYQLPNEHTRVGFLLDAIECNEAPLQAAMANIEDDTEVGGTPTNPIPGKRNDFEAAVAYLLPKDPVARKRIQGSKRNVNEISEAEGYTEISSLKPGMGKTGVHLRWYTKEGFRKLSNEQRNELIEWRSQQKEGNNERGPVKGKHVKKKREAAISAAVDKRLAEKLKETEKDSQDEAGLKAYIMSVIKSMKQDNKQSTLAISASTVSIEKPQVTLQSILKKAKN